MSASPAIPIDRNRVEVLPDRDAWLASRGKDHRIGGSDVARILGRSEYGGPWSLWVERMRRQGGRQDTKDTKRGRDFESHVLNVYGKDYGVAVYLPRSVFAPRHPKAEVVIHGEQSWMVATPDAFVLDLSRTGLWGGGEAKTSVLPDLWGSSCEIFKWELGCEGLLPIEYALQVYWYLEATGLPFYDLCVMVISFGLEIRRYRFYRDEEVQSRLVDRVGEWRERHLIRGESPDPTGESACRDWLGTRFPPSKALRDPTLDERALAEEWIMLKQRMDKDKQRAAQLENLLLLGIGDAGGLILEPGNKAAGRKAQIVRRVYVREHIKQAQAYPARTQPAHAYLKPPHDEA